MADNSESLKTETDTANDQSVTESTTQSLSEVKSSDNCPDAALNETIADAQLCDNVAQDSPSLQRRVKFASPDLTFDEVQKEISSMKAQVGAARNNLHSSGGSTYSTAEDCDLPRSKNMLSHLTSESAMLNYKIQTARNLVRKQEDLLRNLSQMRENMERSEMEIEKVAEFYAIQNRHSNSAQRESQARRQIRCASSEEADRRPSLVSYSGISSLIKTPYYSSAAMAPSYEAINGEEPNFDREMEQIKRRVAEITRRCTEATTTREPLNDTYHDYSSISKYVPTGYAAEKDFLYDQPYEVATPTYITMTNPIRSTYLSDKKEDLLYDDPYEATAPSYSRTTNSGRSSYLDYVLSSLDEYPNTSSYETAPYTDVYTDYRAF